MWNQEMQPDSPPEILAEADKFSKLKRGFGGDLKFYQSPHVIEVTLLLSEQISGMDMTMKL